MRKMRAVGLLAAATMLMAMFAATTTGASAGTPPTVQVGGTCSGSWVTVTAQVAVRSEPSATSTFMFWVVAGEHRTCRKLVAGATYQACGVTNANGWILIQDFKNEYGHGDGWSGYIPSVCTYDGV